MSATPDAREMLKQYYSGDIHRSDFKPKGGNRDPSKSRNAKVAGSIGLSSSWALL
ncbi:rCG28834 [Rattus norvegicus]|uniref:RCG28834 n=1 Tax=Rattus norvegicus TaxID=10116 RepID=A6HV04_RAT|nr:rCG28834 [Rattus norvegicus]